ncbi:redoxin family protein [Phenylobacterium terrae]|uniref:Redoxin family protein n=1 Tax=Phenylobacterium terrae TaxID=2665495 RepID=A0ABW4N7J7_9CAUL
MKLVLAAAALAGSLALAAFGGAPAAQPAAAGAPAQVDNFRLTDHTRFAHDLHYYGYAPAIVVMSQANGTGFSRAAAVELQKLSDAYAGKGVVFFMLNSAEGREAVAAEAKSQGFVIPVLIDELQLVGEQLGVAREGEVFVIDPKTWTVAYRGPLDDRFGRAAVDPRTPVRSPYARQAIEALLAGKAAPAPRAPMTAGKAIDFPARAAKASFATISYARQIAPILQEKCVSCHIKGGIAPFAMDSYEVVKGFSPMIRETIRTRRMPPYFADPHIGTFRNDQGLSPEQTKAIVHWIEAGAPRGDGPDPLLANAGKTAPEWPAHLGEPDVVVELPAFTVPATGLVDYQFMRVENPFKEDTFLRAIAMKPGDRRVLHHVVSNHVPDRTRPRTIPGGSVGSYTPGAEAQVIPDEAGAPVPGGGQLNFQMHYTTMGAETVDKTLVGFYLAKEKPKYIRRSIVIGDFGLRIPAGAQRHTEVAYLTLPADAYLYTLYPHAHYRGIHVELKMIAPDGTETMLLSLPRYDFNWQRDYDPVEPILAKAGSKLVATWVYDNSKHNVANPDPTRDVTWGEQTPDEMMYFRINYRWADETVDRVRNDLQVELARSMMLGMLDNDVDGLLRPEELRGFLAAGIKPRFAALDRNGDGGLDKAELEAAMPRGAFAREMLDTPDL